MPAVVWLVVELVCAIDHSMYMNDGQPCRDLLRVLIPKNPLIVLLEVEGKWRDYEAVRG